jgi:glycosyltransferase involved in cell wall biosynthesis
MPVRVLHVLPALSGYGAERQVANLLPLLQSPALTAGVLTIYRRPETDPCDETYPVLDCGRAKRSDYLFLHRLVARIREFKPDIVHAHTHAGKYWARAAAVLAGVPALVYTEHNPCDPRRGTVERLIDPLLHRLTNRIVTFFGEQRRVLSLRDRVPIEKIVTIPNGLFLHAGSEPPAGLRERLHLRKDRHAVLVVGRLEFQKNQQLALRAIAESEPALKQYLHIYFAGGGSDEEHLRRLTRELGIEEHVSFLGYRNDVADLMAASDAVLMTSHFEGMPLTLIEAMLAGTAVVSTPWTGVREMLDDGRMGFITSGWEPAAVAETLGRALLSHGARASMVQRARAYVEQNYSIAQMAKRHEQLYTGLAGARA